MFCYVDGFPVPRVGTWEYTVSWCLLCKEIFRKNLVNVLKSSRAISRVNDELKTNVSEISSVFIITVGVVNDHTSREKFGPEFHVPKKKVHFNMSGNIKFVSYS
jgi:hypothetical protein